MNRADQQAFLLQRIAKYESAYKSVMKLLKSVDIVNVNSALYMTAQLYKGKISKLRKELREL